MGTTVVVQCNHCSFSQAFTVGMGMVYSEGKLISKKQPLLLNLVESKEEKEIIKEHLKNMPSIKNYSHHVWQCPTCHDFSSHFDFTLSSNIGKYKPKHYCETCNVKLRRVNIEKIDFSKQPCPECGQKELKNGVSVMWD